MPAAESARSRDRLDLLFWLAMAFLLCHELDAVAQHEWRLLPILSGLSDEAAYPWFVLLHAPFFALLFWASGSRAPTLRRRSQLVLDGLFLVHGILHFLLRGDELAPFDTVTSQISIYGAALAGSLHGALVLWGGGVPLASEEQADHEQGEPDRVDR